MLTDRNETRRVFYQAWEKHLQSRPMEPLENMVCSIIEAHPEYQPLLASDANLQRNFTSTSDEQNPFLHMGLHIALLEQISIDRPSGIASLYQKLLGKYKDVHSVQHRMMGCLERVLQSAQRQARPPDEQEYLDSLRELG